MIDPARNARLEDRAVSPPRRFTPSTLRPRLGIAVAVTAMAGVLWLGARLAARHPQFLLGFNPEQDTVNGQPSPVKWQGSTVTWEMNCSVGSNVQVSAGSGCLIESPIKSAFEAWNTTPLSPGGPVITNLTINEGPQTALTDPDAGTSGIDCVNIVSFMASSAIRFPTGAIAFTTLATVFGSPPTHYPCTSNGTTTTKTCNQPACIADADVMFNPATDFSSVQPTPTNAYDIQSVATHEVGHLLGLDHSGIAHSVMYPFGDVGVGQQRSLSTDDILGIGFLYPGASFATATGALEGTVQLNGAGVFGAHVVAIDSATGNVVVDGLTDMQGNYTLDVPAPANYQVLAVPLAGPYSLANFGGWACGYTAQENSPPCCDPKADPTCTGKALQNPTNFTGTYLH